MTDFSSELYGDSNSSPPAAPNPGLGRDFSDELYGDHPTSIIDKLQSQPSPSMFSGDMRESYQGTMNAVKPLNQAVSSAIGTALSPIAPMAHDVSGAIDSTDAGQWIGDKLMEASDAASSAVAPAVSELKDLEGYNPNLAKDLSAFGENAQLAGNAMGAGAALKGIKSAGALLGDSASGAPEAARITTDVATQSGHNAYQAAQDAGGGLNENYVGKIHDLLTDQMKKPINPDLGLTKANSSINTALDDARKELPARGSGMTLPQWQAFDTNLGNIKTAAYQSGDFNTGKAISAVQKQARSMLQNLGEDDVTGGKAGFDILTKDAIPIWAARSKVADIEQAVGGKMYQGVPSTGIKNVFASIANDADAMKQYPAAAQKAIMKAASTGNADDILGILGSRLNPIAALAGSGIPGAVASNVVSKAFRGARTALKYGQAQDVTDAIYAPVRKSIEKFKDYTSPPAAPPTGVPKQLTYQPNIMSVPSEGASGTIPMNPTIEESLGNTGNAAGAKYRANLAATTSDALPMYQEPVPKIRPDEIAAARQAAMSPSGLAAMRQSQLAAETANKEAIRRAFEENTAWSQNKSMNESARQQAVNNVHDQMQKPGFEKLTTKQKTDATKILIQNEIKRQIMEPGSDTEAGLAMKSAFGMKKGGIIKNRTTHLTKTLETKLGRKPKAGEIELAHYVGAHGVHRLLNAKDAKLPAHKMFPADTVQGKRELFFNKKTPYTVEQIRAVL